MPQYVDGFVIVMPKKNVPAYRKMAKDASKIWRKHGALDYKECVGDDVRPKGILATFPKITKAKPQEVVVFSYIVYKSKKQRNEVNKKVMTDPAMKKYEKMPMPFDMKRMTVGGFTVLVD